eukprot:CAMPEP_0174311850 /NCGR_PEP_ID=MMETSP0810-20121108/3951_1 /TAXON_ID=73025 ORGANISM="Eutreptiella gymnastica-like, Strain CCMP1594" /NCGR_SAMPLE_ID=MMETSP0810 /ASSEMBLY_ACC=CAM_ASM_000659 /LENGTH=324 /DNA_ID=CAMNT_0015420153 /DNA_START=103 /DNA_END=1077 /DNA_ORIENTATION=+
MSSVAVEAKLQNKYPNISIDVLRHLLNITGGDPQVVQEQLRIMSMSEIHSLEASLREVPGRNLTGTQKQRVKEFKAVSAVSNDKVAVKMLMQNGWDVESALNAFFSGGAEDDDGDEVMGSAGAGELNDLFEKYKAIGIEEGAAEGTTNMEGAALHSFSQDIDAEDEDGYCLYVIAFLVKASIPLTFTKEEFVSGLMDLGVRSLADIKKNLPNWKSQLQRDGVFREFYRFCYDWMKESPATRVLGCETACDLWTMFFKGQYPLLEHWVDYVKTHFKKAITKDVWYQFLDFTNLKPDLSDYDVDGAWPVLFDEFVDHAKATFLAPK